MTKLIRSELRKLLSTRSTYGIVAAAIAVVALGALQTSVPAEAVKVIGERQFFLLAMVNTQVFLLVLGAKAVTDEYRHGTVVPTFLVTPRRDRVVVAKLVVLAGAGLVTTALALGAMLAAARPGLDGADIRPLAAYWAAGAVWTVLGGALGWIVRHQVGAIVGAIVWVMAGEQMLLSRWEGIAGFLPGGAAGSLAVGATAGTALVAALILMAYAAGGGLAAAVVTRRRDVA